MSGDGLEVKALDWRSGGLRFEFHYDTENYFLSLGVHSVLSTIQMVRCSLEDVSASDRLHHILQWGCKTVSPGIPFWSPH